MSRRRRIWLVVLVLFNLVNLGGAVYAAYMREGPHAGIHVALLLVGLFLMWRLVSAGAGAADELALAGAPDEFTDRLSHLEQSVDAVAIEVERIGEGQRFMTRVLTDEDAPPAADPVELRAPSSQPPLRRE